MKAILKNSSLLRGLILTFIGIIFLIIENTFYQYLDENLVLHESLFMPLGVFTSILGVLFLTFSAVKFILSRSKRN